MTSAAPARANRLGLALAFAAIYVFWGATFLAIRYAVREIPPLLVMAARCAGGAAILVAFLAWRRELDRPTRGQLITTAVAGLLLFVGCHGLLAWAEQRVSSGQAALYATSIPLWVVLLDALRARRAPAARVLAGIALGVVGVGVLTANAAAAGGGSAIDRIALIVGGFFWAAGSLIARDGPRVTHAAQSTAMQLAAGAAGLLAAAALTGELSRGWSPADVTTRGTSALAFLIVCGTVLGFGAYTWLMRVTTAAAVNTSSFVNPVVALTLGWIVGDDAITWHTAVGAALVVGAVFLTWEAGSHPRDRPEAVARTGARSPGATHISVSPFQEEPTP